MLLDPGKLNKRIQIERPVANTAFKGAGSGQWEAVGKPVWAEVEDMLPSRGERLAGGINVATRPARVRMRYRAGITPDMRFVMGARVMPIVAGPAEIDGGDGLEFMVEDYSTAGSGA